MIKFFPKKQFLNLSVTEFECERCCLKKDCLRSQIFRIQCKHVSGTSCSLINVNSKKPYSCSQVSKCVFTLNLI